MMHGRGTDPGKRVGWCYESRLLAVRWPEIDKSATSGLISEPNDVHVMHIAEMKARRRARIAPDDNEMKQGGLSWRFQG